MPNLFANAANFYQQNEINAGILSEENKKKQIEELKKVIEQSQIIQDEDEKNIIKLLPFFSQSFLHELKNIVIQETLRNLSSKHQK